MKKIKIRKMVIVALLIGLNIVFSRLASISTWSLKISLTFTTGLISGYLYGPLYAALVCGIGDIIGALCFPIGEFNPLFTLTAIVSGLIYGTILYDNLDTKRIVLAVVLNQIGCSLLLNTYFISLVYNVSFFHLLTTRIVQSLIMLVIEYFVIRAMKSFLFRLKTYVDKDKPKAVDFIENRPWQGSSLDLDRMKKLMSLLGNPQDELKYIHVAGTNGKGSACAMLTSILMDAGYKVGTYISPHLIKYEERFSINNINISEKEFELLTDKIKKISSKLDFEPRVFEILTAIAFLYFKRHNVDVVVLEVGMGGRLDATNIIKESLVSLIMNIGLEHTEILGNTLEEIAREKSGIIKEYGDVVFYQNKKEVMNVFNEVVDTKNAKAVFTNFKNIEILHQDNDYSVFNYKNIKKIKLSLLGKHQFNNAVVVIEAINILNKKGYKITNKNIKNGLKNVKWAARLSILSKEPLFILDGAHNPQCANALKKSLPQLLKRKKAIFLCGMLKDKDYESVMDMMIPYAKEFICVTPNSVRALNSSELKRLLKKKGQEANVAQSIKEGIELSLDKAGKNGIVVCFGSLYLAGDVLNNFELAYKNYKLKQK